MMDIINYYPETLQEFNLNNKLKINKQKKWKSTIDYKFVIKSDIYSLNNIYGNLKYKCDLDGCAIFPFEKITIPQNFVNIINKNTNFTNISFDFIPGGFAFNLKFINNQEEFDEFFIGKLKINLII
jgi:hypothetical protein